ncbi:MAG: YciI family protein [Acidobacteriaceae bacterium]
MPDYIYLIHPLRHEFFDAPTPQEEAVMEAHYAYLKEGTSRGQVLLAGPCLDQTFGVVILRVASEAAARAFMLDDPSVKNNIMIAELHPLKISMMQPR